MEIGGLFTIQSCVPYINLLCNCVNISGEVVRLKPSFLFMPLPSFLSLLSLHHVPATNNCHSSLIFISSPPFFPHFLFCFWYLFVWAVNRLRVSLGNPSLCVILNNNNNTLLNCASHTLSQHFFFHLFNRITATVVSSQLGSVTRPSFCPFPFLTSQSVKGRT